MNNNIILHTGRLWREMYDQTNIKDLGWWISLGNHDYGASKYTTQQHIIAIINMCMIWWDGFVAYVCVSVVLQQIT